MIDLNDLDSLNKVNAELATPVHWGFVARLDPTKPLAADQQPEKIALALAHGALAVVADDKLEPRAKQLIEAFGIDHVERGGDDALGREWRALGGWPA